MSWRGHDFVRWASMSDQTDDEWLRSIVSFRDASRETPGDSLQPRPSSAATATTELQTAQPQRFGEPLEGGPSTTTRLSSVAAVQVSPTHLDADPVPSAGTPSLTAQAEGAPPTRPSKWRRRLVVAVIAGQTLAIVMLLATMKLFVYPRIDEPRKVDAIVVLGGLGERIERGVQLYQAGYGQELWISVPQWANGEYPYVYECTQRMTNFGEHCFDPRPKTTQGEARVIANLAAEHGWDSVMVVTTPDQTTRARMVIKRCYSGELAMLDAPNQSGRFFKLAYEWGATIKALTIKRGC
jgi:hypothetical protein